MIFKDIQGVWGSSLGGGWYPLACSLSCVYTKCQYMCNMHKMYMCAHLDGKIGCTYEELAAKRICYCFKYCTPYSERQNVYN